MSARSRNVVAAAALRGFILAAAGAALAALPAFVPSPTAAATLLGLVDTGEMFASENGGLTWTARSTLPVRDAVGLAARASSLELCLATRSGTLYRSLDAGFTWTAVGGVPASDVADIAVTPDLAVLLLTATGALYRNTDAGASFTAIAALTGSNFVSLALTMPAARFYVLTATGELWESTDDGASWVVKGAISVSNAVELRSLGDALYVLTSTGDVHRSSDQGTSWVAVGTLSQSGMAAMARDGPALVASTAAGEVARSADGASWAWQGVINQLTVTALGTDTPASTGVEEPTDPGPNVVALPWPNPAREGTALHLSFRLGREARVELALVDLAGRRVAMRGSEVFTEGVHTLRWEAPARGAGFYFVRLTADGGESGQARWVVVR